VKRCEEEVNQLDRVQNLFPNDALYLHDKDALSLKMKGLIRKRSTTAARLQRAFSAKTLRSSSTTDMTDSPGGHVSTPTTSAASLASSVSIAASTPSTPSSPAAKSTAGAVDADKRQFIMETPVQFINGLQSQERHLFLFNDLLLIAKARSSGNFKLKDKVRISELWLATCVDDVAEVTKSRDTSFVIGWPTINVVATFSSAVLRDLWWNKLGQVIQDERQKEPKATTIQVTYHDAVQGIEYFKTLSVSCAETVRDCIKLVLSHLEMPAADAGAFRLWVKTGASDESPYPLFGHELPFAIKMNCIREFVNNDDGFDLDHCNNIYSADPATRCQFILRSVQKANYNVAGVNGSKASAKGKAKKSPTRIQRVFRRVQSKPDSLEILGTSPGSNGSGSGAGAGALFAQQLTKICSGDQLPQPIIDMLVELRNKGSQTVGIFRKSANARQVREMRERIDSGEEMDWSNVSAVVTAVVFKDFLRSLPDSLLGSAMYDQWLQVATMDSIEAALDKIKALCERLPSANISLLRHFLCVLLHISNSSSVNMMSASNLAVCVGPSLLWANCNVNSSSSSSNNNNSSSSSSVNPALALSAEATASKQVPALVAMLIDKCTVLFGADTANLLNENNCSKGQPACAGGQNETRRMSSSKDYRNKAPVQKHMARHGLLQHDSGNEESDSLHSLYHSEGMRRDDSSIDSLERELLGDAEEAFDDSHHHHHHHHAIHLRRDKMSVTNLSRDSGLTLSDTQLYTPDEDIGSESSSSGRGSDRDKSRNVRDVLRPRTTTSSSSSSRLGLTAANHQQQQQQSRSLYSVPVRSATKASASTSASASASAFVGHSKVGASYSAAAASTTYTPVYEHHRKPEAIYRKLSEDVVYAVPKATPTVILGEEYQESTSSQHFQRQDWFRRKSHTRKTSAGAKEDCCHHMGMRRSASDESLINLPMTSMTSSTDVCGSKKPASHRKGRAPAPPCLGNRRPDVMELSRSKSDANLGHPDPISADSCAHDLDDSRLINLPQGQKTTRSQSTPHIDEVDRSYDSSTLSDDDSTPHVSRSNSRGKDYRAVNSAWETAYGALTVPVPAPIHIIVSQDGSGSIIYPNLGYRNKSVDDTSNRRSYCSSTPRSAERSRNGPSNRSSQYAPTPLSSTSNSNGARNYADYDVVYSNQRRSHDASPSLTSGSRTPDIPTYEEALIRRRMPTKWTTWKDTSPSNLIQVRASPIRLNSQDSGSAPPLPPKSEAPPLPPKQRIHLRTTPHNSGKAQAHTPLKMRSAPPPRRTRPVTIHMDASILSNMDAPCVSSPPPSLPAKERSARRNVSVVAIENNYAPLHRSFAFSTRNLRHQIENARDDDEELSSPQNWSVPVPTECSAAGTGTRDQDVQTSGHWAQFCEIETQTSLSPQPSLTSSSDASDASTDVNNISNINVSHHLNSSPSPKKLTLVVGRYEKNVKTERGRDRQRPDSGALHRSQSLPPLDQKTSSSTDASDASSDSSCDSDDADEQVTTSNGATSQQRRAEISWSVSQLRAIFSGNSTAAGVAKKTSTVTIPPPYRSPPSHGRQRSDSTDSCGEESYV